MLREWWAAAVREAETRPRHAPLLRDGRLIDLTRLVLTLFLAGVLCSITPAQRQLGQSFVIVFLSILIGHPSRTIGAQLVFTVLGCIGTMLSAAYCIVAWEFAAIVNRNHQGMPNNSGPMLLFCFFIFSQYWMGFIKVYKPILTHFSLCFQTITVFQLPVNVYSTKPPRMAIWQFSYDFMLGMGICQLTNLFFFPKTATHVFHNKLSNTLKMLGDFIDKSAIEFFSNECVYDADISDQRIGKMRKEINLLHTTRHHLSNELILGYFQPDKWKPVVSICNLIEQQVETMQSCLAEKSTLFKAHKRIVDILTLKQMNATNVKNDTSPVETTSERGRQGSLQRMESWATELFTDPAKAEHGKILEDTDVVASPSGSPTESTEQVSIAMDISQPKDNTNIPTVIPIDTTQTAIGTKDNSPTAILKSSASKGSALKSSNIVGGEHAPEIVIDKVENNSNIVTFGNESKADPTNEGPRVRRKNVQFLHSRKASIEEFGLIDALPDADFDDDHQFTHDELNVKPTNQLTSILDDYDNIPDIELHGDYSKFMHIMEAIGTPIQRVCGFCSEALTEASTFVGQNLGKQDTSHLVELADTLRMYYADFDNMLASIQTKVNFDAEVLSGIEQASKSSMGQYARSPPIPGRSPLESLNAGVELVGESNGEELFLVFYCAFAVKCMLHNIINLVDHVRRLGDIAHSRKRRKIYLPVLTKLLKFTTSADDNPIWSLLYARENKKKDSSARYPGVSNMSLEIFSERVKKETTALLSPTGNENDLYPQDDTVMVRHREQYINQMLNANTARSFGQLTQHSDIIAQIASMDVKSMYTTERVKLPTEDSENSLVKICRRYLFAMSKFIKTYPSKHGIQLVLANGSMSLFGFLHGTQGWFTEWRGSWMLVTITYVLSPTVGDSTLVGLYRTAGTIVGSVWAYVSWLIIPNNPYFGLFMMAVLDYFAGYIQLFGPYNKVGLICALSYGIVYFNSRNYWHVPISDAALRRCVMVILGCVCSMVTSMLVFPVKASASSRNDLSNILESLSILFSQSIFHMMKPPEMRDNVTWEKEIAAQHKTLHKISLGVESMSSMIPGELQLEKKFPMKTYQHLIDSTNKLITATVELALTCGKVGDDCYKTIIMDPKHVQLRKEYVAVMLLHFHMVTMAIRFKTPVPQKLPSARAARRRFLAAVYNTLAERQSNNDSIEFLHWNAYMMALEEVILNLYNVSTAMRGLFGETRHVDLGWDKMA